MSTEQGSPITPSEAVFGFMSWLTARERQSGPFSSTHGHDQAFELCEEFCQEQNWPAPRDGWDFRVRFPKDPAGPAAEAPPKAPPPPIPPHRLPAERGAPMQGPEADLSQYQQRIAAWVTSHWRTTGIAPNGAQYSAIRACPGCGSMNWYIGFSPITAQTSQGVTAAQVALVWCARCGEIRMYNTAVLAAAGVFDGLPNAPGPPSSSPPSSE